MRIKTIPFYAQASTIIIIVHIYRGMTMNGKKGWETPKVIVMGRGTPEESVLTGCKRSGTSGPRETGYCKANPSCADNATS